MSPKTAETLAALVAGWVARQPDLRGLALAGSWARGNARPESDLDLVILATDQDRYRRDAAWLGTLGLEGAGYRIVARTPAPYGVVWSWHLQLEPDAKLELAFAGPDWASINPVDAGTRRVVDDAFKILVDKDGRLGALLDARDAADRPPNAR
jgi:hypothetical protein